MLDGCTLKAIAALGLLSHNIQDRVDKLGTLCVVPLGPVVACASLQDARMLGVHETLQHATRLPAKLLGREAKRAASIGFYLTEDKVVGPKDLTEWAGSD